MAKSRAPLMTFQSQRNLESRHGPEGREAGVERRRDQPKPGQNPGRGKGGRHVAMCVRLCSRRAPKGI